ncbi:class I SAM-dependent DNA methyltransferase [Aquipseudomonas alcaligenes]|uniref:site-specific DNA-methyltransferase (adenine-specific) n=1 Tax=Aquipseudomonas alcaligenes TaxID=43263 RepID=A0AB73I2M1_AQUAC|nr:DNA methyltransferase [Pseudomonas alcaligenes]MDH0144406.1 class I SAM-dependent DNA methyltransferase [Pseudomonas alcaligenes]MEE1951082.1 DNA methyltransferase [Pseudomonas alcaligenes]
MEHLDTFLSRWGKAGGTERANYQLFLTELCSLLGLPLPEPAGDDTRDNAYVFERRVVINQPDGSSNNGFIDLYKRGSFVLEAKQTGKTLDSSGWDKAMLKAHNQADQYARALPAEEGRPPFILVVDVGRNIELYAEFSRSGATYTPYPDARNHRIRLEDLRKEDVRERLRAVWLDPLSLDPARRSARVTREIADQLAKLAKSLEADGHSPQLVASFLMRALFTMFAEDVGLLPERGFTELLQRLKSKPDTFAPMLENLWQTMNSGGFSPILESTLLKFNGGLFAEAQAIALDRDQMELLLKASEADWRYVEPAIFGTLLERALNPRERHKLGAHYTPRAYVERLVLPTVIEPLRAEWKEVQVAALTYEGQGKHKEAVAEIRAFHRHLCEVRVLDPACGSGNFLYVTLEHMKRLEGEVLNLLHDLGESQGLLELEGVTVDPHQFLGLEINPRAARIAEMVLWIGYLQWHFRTHGKVNPPEPVLRDFHNIEHRDALIAYDAVELLRDESGKPITHWDGITTKTSPITGEQVPDESAQVEQYLYRNPRKAEWPQADYIVGNPPFIGAKMMRMALGDGYVDAIQTAWPEVPQATDFVLRWWHQAAGLVAKNKAKTFGFITSNSISQTFNRRVIEPFLADEKHPLSLIFVIPDHPWVDSSDGAAVRIAITAARAGHHEATLLSVKREHEKGATPDDDLVEVFSLVAGKAHANLKVGANLNKAAALQANRGICAVGFKTIGAAFQVDKETASSLGLGTIEGCEKHIRPYLNGRDLAAERRGIYVIDLFGLSRETVQHDYPAVYQYLLDRAKPERDQNRNKIFRENWWIIGHPRPIFRQFTAGLTCYIATIETSKHRFFTCLPSQDAPDSTLVTFGLSDAVHLGLLSSRIHITWALAAGGRLGVGNDPRYNKTRCFETFPFPEATPEQQAQIRDLAERLDAHRKRQQAQHPELTLTGMYNVLEKLRSEEPLTAKDKTIHEQGLVSVLRELHDELDRVVFAVYGWDDLAAQLVGKPGATTPLPDKAEAQAEAEEELLRRLVALNAERAAEEARGLVRWLRPEYQNPSAQSAPQQSEAELADTTDSESVPEASTAAGKLTWPKQMREQVAAVRQALAQGPLPTEAIAAQFKRSPKIAVQAVLDALEELGMVQQDADQYRLAS